MTTLHVDDDALREAVAAYPTVAGVESDADFPHGAAHRGHRSTCRSPPLIVGGAAASPSPPTARCCAATARARCPPCPMRDPPGGTRLHRPRRPARHRRPRRRAGGAARARRTGSQGQGRPDVAPARRPHAGLRRPEPPGRQVGGRGRRAAPTRPPGAPAISTSAIPERPAAGGLAEPPNPASADPPPAGSTAADDTAARRRTTRRDGSTDRRRPRRTAPRPTRRPTPDRIAGLHLSVNLD